MSWLRIGGELEGEGGPGPSPEIKKKLAWGGDITQILGALWCQGRHFAQISSYRKFPNKCARHIGKALEALSLEGAHFHFPVASYRMKKSDYFWLRYGPKRSETHFGVKGG